MSGTIHLSALRKPILDAKGFPMNSEYTEHFWLPILGPSATWLVRRLANVVRDTSEPVTLDAFALAASLGMSYSPGKVGPFMRAVQRSIMFNFVHVSPHNDDQLFVRVVAPQLPLRLINRLPEASQIAIEKWHQQPTPTPVT